MKVVDGVQSYSPVFAAQKNQSTVPEESRRIILRLPSDSVFISEEARALHRGQLHVRMDAEGTFARVTDRSSDPTMKLIEKAMREVKKTLDSIKTLTKTAEDETLSDADRYSLQIQIAEHEGRLEKIVYKMQEDYEKLHGKIDNGTEPLETESAAAGKDFSSSLFYVMDTTRGKRYSFAKYADMIDKRTELKVEMINRVRMRELDPEAYSQHIEQFRKIYREEYESGAWAGISLSDTANLKISGSPADVEQGNVANQGYSFENKTEGFGQSAVYEVATPEVPQTPAPEIDWKEIMTQDYVERQIAKLEEEDYRAFNAMRISVMSPKLAKESGDFVEDLTYQLTKRFEHFTDILQRVERKDPFACDDEMKSRLIGELFGNIKLFLEETLLHRIKKDAVREPAAPNSRAVKTIQDGNAFEYTILS